MAPGVVTTSVTATEPLKRPPVGFIVGVLTVVFFNVSLVVEILTLDELVREGSLVKRVTPLVEEAVVVVGVVVC